MQESWEFKLHSLDTIQNELELESAIQQFFFKEQKNIGIFLSYYFKKDGAIVENVKCTHVHPSNNLIIGKIKVEFQLIHFNACLNIHENDYDEMFLDYHLDKEKEKILLTGPFWAEREPDEI